MKERVRRTIPISRPGVGEEEARAVYETIKTGQLCEGPRVREFEEAFAALAGVKHAVVCFNGTVALHLLWRALGIGPGDEVIVPSLTFISTAVSLLFTGATPVFADVDRRTYNLDPEDAERKITSRTRAIMPVHYGGQIADMEKFTTLAEKHGLFLCEDAAEASGARLNGRHAGSFGKASIFSFTPTKNMTTGEGGMITTNDDEIAAKVRLLKNHGQDREYHHIEVGYNYRMTEMQAAMGIVQLKKLPGTIEIKNRNARYYTSALSSVEGLTTPYVAPGRNHTFMLYTLTIDPQKVRRSRDEIMHALREQGIQAKVYFFPAHLQPLFLERGYRRGDLPVTESLWEQILSLPIHSQLDEEDLAYVTENLKDIITRETVHRGE